MKVASRLVPKVTFAVLQQLEAIERPVSAAIIAGSPFALGFRNVSAQNLLFPQILKATMDLQHLRRDDVERSGHRLLAFPVEAASHGAVFTPVLHMLFGLVGSQNSAAQFGDANHHANCVGAVDEKVDGAYEKDHIDALVSKGQDVLLQFKDRIAHPKIRRRTLSNFDAAYSAKVPTVGSGGDVIYVSLYTSSHASVPKPHCAGGSSTATIATCKERRLVVNIAPRYMRHVKTGTWIEKFQPLSAGPDGKIHRVIPTAKDAQGGPLVPRNHGMNSEVRAGQELGREEADHAHFADKRWFFFRTRSADKRMLSH